MIILFPIQAVWYLLLPLLIVVFSPSTIEISILSFKCHFPFDTTNAAIHNLFENHRTYFHPQSKIISQWSKMERIKCWHCGIVEGCHTTGSFSRTYHCINTPPALPETLGRRYHCPSCPPKPTKKNLLKGTVSMKVSAASLKNSLISANGRIESLESSNVTRTVQSVALFVSSC